VAIRNVVKNNILLLTKDQAVVLNHPTLFKVQT